MNPQDTPGQNIGANSPPSTGDQALDAQKAADLIRQQIQSIYAGQGDTQPQTGTNTRQVQQTAPVVPPVNEVSPIASQTPAATPAQPVAPPIQTPVQTPISQQAPQPINTVAQTQQPPAHFNPYHKATNPIVAANAQPNSPTAMPTASQQQPQIQQPGGASYRNNYATFHIPGTPSAASNDTSTQRLQEAPSAQQPNNPMTGAINSQASVVMAPGLDPNKPPVISEPNQTPSVADLKDKVIKRVKEVDAKKIHHRLKPLFVSLAIGLLFLGINYNEVAVAQVKQYISPGDAISTPVILDPSASVKVGPEPKIIIPKINLDVPVIYDIKGYDEKQIQDGLERGVVHYGTTALPGEKGNNVIVGHSSNNYFNSGEYKFAFVLLFRLEKGDTFILNYKGKRYVYKVFNKQVIDPDNFTYIQPTERPITTLITCTPPGTSWKRLIVQGEQISPNPDDAAESTESVPENIDTPVPGYAPSLWQRITESIF